MTCSNQNSGVGRIDSFQFFYFIIKAVVVQLLPQDKFQEWKCQTKCSTHWNFRSILPTCHIERFYNFKFLSTVFAYLYSKMHFKSSFLKKSKFCIYLIFSFFSSCVSVLHLFVIFMVMTKSDHQWKVLQTVYLMVNTVCVQSESQ